MIRFEPQFAFQGGRDYVHGPSIFGCFHAQVLAAAAAGPADMVVRRFRVNRLIRQNHAAYIHGPGEAPAAGGRGQPLVEMACVLDGARWTAVLAEAATGPVTERTPSFEKDFVRAVVAREPFAGTAELIRLKDNDSLFQAAVEANKQLHLATVKALYPGRACKFRFVYCLDYTCPATLPANAGQVTIRNLGIQETDTHIFTLNQVDIGLGEWRSGFRICFASEDLRALGFTAAGKVP